MTTNTEPSLIAAGLSKAQREFMLLPMYSVLSQGIAAAWCHDTGYKPARIIAMLGLARRVPIYSGTIASVPTDLGKAVRAHLIAQEQNQ